MARRFVTLRVWHEGCWMLEMADRHRDISVSSRGISSSGGTVNAGAVIHAHSHDALQSALATRFPSEVHLEVLHESTDAAEIFSTYPTHRSAYDAAIRSGFLLHGPVHHANGYEKWHVVAETDKLDAGVAMLRQTCEVTVERVSDTPPRDHDADLIAQLATDLSPRQFELLQRAVEDGYYEWPRSKNVKRIAADFGISGPTALEHIRRAESRVIPSLVAELARARRVK